MALPSSPLSVTTDGTNLYVTDLGNACIRKIEIATGTVTTLAGSAGVAGTADGIGSAAAFSGPAGITCDGTNLFVIDWGGYGVRTGELQFLNSRLSCSIISASR